MSGGETINFGFPWLSGGELGAAKTVLERQYFSPRKADVGKPIFHLYFPIAPNRHKLKHQV